MRLENKTNMRVPKKWLQKLIDHLGVNPEIVIDYADDYKTDPDNANCMFHESWAGNKKYVIDGYADEANRVQLFVGTWRKGKRILWSQRYLKWVLAHELRHQYYNYRFGLATDPFVGLKKVEREKREERACNRFASLLVGVPKRDFKVLQKDVKNSGTTNS